MGFHRKSKKRRRTLIGKIFRTTLTAAAGWIAFSNLGIDHNMELPDALDTERKRFFSPKAGKLSYYVSPQAKGRPLVLIHSVNAAASAFEMRPLFEHYRAGRPVYALDLPGFGFSERSPRDYNPQMYEDAILDFLNQEVKAPADLIALSLGCEFAARAAVRRPDLVHSLALISPTGFSAEKRGSATQQAGQAQLGNALHSAFSVGLWARPFFDLLATLPSIQYFLQKSFVGAVNADMIDYAYRSAHQPGAEYAPLHFISGRLFTRNIREVYYSALTRPALVLYDHDAFTSFERLPDVLAARENWQAARIVPSLGLPHWEQPAQTIAAMDRFWDGFR